MKWLYGSGVVPAPFFLYKMIVQGINLLSSFDGVKLPKGCKAIESVGMPEISKGGAVFLLGKDGKLYPRVVNNGRHVAITIPAKGKLPKATIFQANDSK